MDRRWAIALALAFVLTLTINPVGYIGGGLDDWQYLAAARCWSEQGACLPQSHWEGRWPVFLPIAITSWLLGESRLTVGLWPLACSIAAVGLLAIVGNRIAGRPAGWLAAIVFLVIPAFSIQILDPSVEALELALILFGVWKLLDWKDHRTGTAAAVAGLAFGLAFQVRETALVAALLAGLAALTWKPSARHLALAVAGFAAPLAAELLVYGLATGDPLFRRNLSIAHARLPSSELLGPVDHERAPFFNRNYIANWRHEPGVHLHWAIDGLVNLFINAKAGAVMLLTPLLLLLAKKPVEPGRWSKLWALYGLAIVYALVIIYPLAMDPKARVMLVPLSLASLAFATCLFALASNGLRLLSATLLGSHVLLGWVILWAMQRTDVAEPPARQWIARHGDQIAIDPNTRRHLALVPEAGRLPGLDAGKPMLLFNSVTKCSRFIARAKPLLDGAVIVGEVRESKGSLLLPDKGPSMCLIRLARPTDGRAIRAAIIAGRMDGRYILSKDIYVPSKKD